MANKPLTSLICTLSVSEQSAGKDVWYVPKISREGYATRELYISATNMTNQFKDYEVEYKEPEIKAEVLKDEIPF